MTSSSNARIRAVQVLTQVETRLRELIAESASEGDYANVLQLTEWARSVTEMLNKSEGQFASTELPVVPEASGGTKAEATQKPMHGRALEGYPRFFRQSDRLIRVAWSKREKQEYEHRAPLSLASTVTEAIAHAGAGGKVFTADEILPIKGASGDDIPNYQVYAVIALLKRFHLIDQHGRQGYSVPKLPGLQGRVSALLQSLPEKQS